MKNHLIVAGMLTLLVALSLAPMASAITDPYIVYGNIYYNGVLSSGAVVTIENMRTSETISTTTDINGYYSENLLNMPSDWQDGDTIRVSATCSSYSSHDSIVVASEDEGQQVDLYVVTPGGGEGGVDIFDIAVRVIDSSTLRPVSGATIRIFSDSKDEIGSSDSNGYATMSILDGDNTIVIEKAGYQKYTQSLSSRAGLLDQINIFKITPIGSNVPAFSLPGFESILMIAAMACVMAVAIYRRW
jgi:hypothetical protein